MIGNVLDHYDTALYGFLAPVIAPLFFPQHDYIVSLIMAYGLLSVGLITRPLGTIFFAHIAEKYTANRALSLSLLGIGFSTGMIGMLPIYDTIGTFAPICLAVTRMLQGFFSSGETTVANVFLMAEAPEKHRGKINSIYQCSVMLGIIIASLAATFIVSNQQWHGYWRIPFLFGFISCIFGGLWRYYHAMEKPVILKQVNRLNTILFNRKLKFLAAVLASSFTYLTYAIPFIFMNSFVPQISSITLKEMMMANSALLVLDMMILPIFGWLTDRYSPARVMQCATISLAVTIVPAFALLSNASLFMVCLVRIWIIILGLAFLAPFSSWLYHQFTEKKYLLTGFSYSLGTELFGRSSPIICLWLWHKTQNIIVPALFIAFISLLTAICILLVERRSLKKALHAH
jgi:MFS family permease